MPVATPTANPHESGQYHADDQRPAAWALPLIGDCTIRWQRGDTVAHIVKGKWVSVLVVHPFFVR